MLTDSFTLYNSSGTQASLTPQTSRSSYPNSSSSLISWLTGINSLRYGINYTKIFSPLYSPNSIKLKIFTYKLLIFHKYDLITTKWGKKIFKNLFVLKKKGISLISVKNNAALKLIMCYCLPGYKHRRQKSSYSWCVCRLKVSMCHAICTSG
jgi:hypothetical protein